MTNYTPLPWPSSSEQHKTFALSELESKTINGLREHARKLSLEHQPIFWASVQKVARNFQPPQRVSAMTANPEPGLRDVLNISQEVMTSQLFSGIIGRETLTRYENGTWMISDSNRVLIALLLKARLDSVPLKKRKNSGHRMV